VTVSVSYDATLSRARLTADGLPAAAVSVRVERSTDQVRWVTVRGGGALAPSSQTVSVDDYEAPHGQLVHYRATSYNGSGSQAGQQHGSIVMPGLQWAWLKSLARPFLNRQVRVLDHSDVRRPGRTGVFAVIGRSMPVAVTDVAGSRQWTLQLRADSPEAAQALDMLVASGDVLLIQAPTVGRLAHMPAGYVVVEDSRVEQLPTLTLWPRVVSWTLVEVAAPGPDVVGATSNYETIRATYATYADQLAAHATYGSLLELIGDPEDVIVP